MITNPRPSNHDSAERSKQVMIRRFTPDWDFLAETTNARMHGVLEMLLPGSWYLNPIYTVHAEEPTKAFFRKARKCQADWFRTMSDSLGSATRRRTQKSTNDERERRLSFSGILIVDGKVLDPDGLDAEQNTPVADSEWRLYTANPRELAVATLQQVAERLNDARQAQAEAAELLQQDRPADAMKHVTVAIEAWQQTQQAVLYSATLVGIDLDGRAVDGQPVDQIVLLLLDQLKELRELLSAGDTVAMADALAYEWPQTIDRWQVLIGKLIDWVTEE